MILKYLGVSILSVCLLTACQNEGKNSATVAAQTAEQTTSQPTKADNADKNQASDVQGERKLLLDEPDDERKTYYFPDSVKKSDEGLIAVMVEMAQKPVPEDNTALVRQQMIVDCQYKLAAPVSVSLLDSQGKQLEAEEFEYPDYKAFSADELKNAQESNDEATKQLIATVCKS